MTVLGLPASFLLVLIATAILALLLLRWLAKKPSGPVLTVGVELPLPLNISIPTRHRALVEARKNGKV